MAKTVLPHCVVFNLARILLKRTYVEFAKKTFKTYLSLKFRRIWYKQTLFFLCSEFKNYKNLVQ